MQHWNSCLHGRTQILIWNGYFLVMMGCLDETVTSEYVRCLCNNLALVLSFLTIFFIWLVAIDQFNIILLTDKQLLQKTLSASRRRVSFKCCECAGFAPHGGLHCFPIERKEIRLILATILFPSRCLWKWFKII